MQRWVRLLAILVAASGVTIILAGTTPEQGLAALGEKLGHADDVTPDRVFRFRIACWAAGVVIAACGSLAGTVGREAVCRFVGTLCDEWKAWRPRVHLRQTAAQLRAPGMLYFTAFVVVRIAGVVMRLRYIARPMLYDEAYSFLNFARRPLYQALADYSSTNNHLLNTALMHLAYVAAGQRDWALRVHTVIAGMLLLPACYFFARKTLGPAAALIGTALVASSPMLIHYSVEARGYILVALFSVWTADRFAAALTSGRRMDWVLATLCAVAGFFAMPIMLYPFTGCMVWGLVVRSSRGLAPRDAEVHTIAAHAPSAPAIAPTRWAAQTCWRSSAIWAACVLMAVVLLYLPAWVFRGMTAYEPQFVRPLSVPEWTAQFPSALGRAVVHGSLVPLWTRSSLPVLVVIVLASIGFSSLYFEKHDETAWVPARWLFLFVPAATLAALVVGRLAPPPRVFLMLAPWWLLMAGNGMAVLLRSAHGWTARRADPIAALVALSVIAVALGFVLTHATPYFPGEKDLGRDVPKVAEVLKQQVQKGHRVLVLVPYDKPLEYELVKRGVAVHSEVALNGTPQAGEVIWLVKPRVWFPRANEPPLQLSVEEALRQVPSPQWGQFQDFRAIFDELGEWQLWQHWDRLELWMTSIAQKQVFAAAGAKSRPQHRDHP